MYEPLQTRAIQSNNFLGRLTVPTWPRHESSAGWPTNSRSAISFQVLQDLELNPGNVEFAIRPIEALSPSVLRRAQIPHRHDFYEIAWISRGQGAIWIDDNNYPIQPNTLCFVSPGQVHAWKIETSPVGFILGFTHPFFAESPDSASALLDSPYSETSRPVPVLSVNEERADLFTRTCNELLHESQLELLGQRALLRSYMRILLIEARRLHQSQPVVSHAGEVRIALTQQFMLLVEQHYLDTSSVADYAAMLHVTTNHLIETVKANLGQPAGKIIRERLLLEAKRLLRYSDQPVAEIATHLNFEDPSYFSRFFKEKTGFSPTEFRAECQSA